MSGTLSIPNAFAAQGGNVPASQLDTNYSTIANYVNAREVAVGLLAARPAAGTAGRWYFATDVTGGTLYIDNGTSWVDAAAPVNSNKSFITFSSRGTAVASGTLRFLSTADISNTEGSVAMRVPYTGVARNLRCNSSTVPGAGQTYAYVLRNSFTTTALVCTTSGAGSSGSEDLVNAVTFTANAQICLQITTSATADGTGVHWATLEFDAS